MELARGANHGLSYIQEEEFGVTPDNPQMKDLRHTSCSLVLNRDSFQSNELRPDAQIADFRLGIRQVGGDVAFELSYGEFDDFLAAAVRGKWDGNTLIAGIDTPTFTFERVFEKIGRYETFTGCAINSLSLQIQPNNMITGTFGIIGKDADFSQNPLAQTRLPSLTNSPLDGFKGELKEGGVPVSVITSISINIDNGMETANAIGHSAAVAIIPKRINITGSISAFFENMDLLKKFLDEIESELVITLGDGGPGSYVITLPRIAYSGASNPADGEGPIMLDMPFQALLDDCTGTNIIIERIPLPDKISQPCSLTWSATSLSESTYNDGSITGDITVTLSGGNGKGFAGHNGRPMPGVIFTGLPAGLTGNAERLSDTSCKISVSGKATNHGAVAGEDFSVKFTAAAFAKGFCECTGDTVANGEKTIDITFTD